MSLQSMRFWRGVKRTQCGLGFVLCSVMASHGTAKGEFESVGEARAVDRASALVSSSESSKLALVREVQMWRRRALEAESRLQDGAAGVQTGATGETRGAGVLRGRFEVVSVMASERVLIFSAGRDSGLYEGALVRLETGLVAKIVEARRSCSAAVLESSFRGNPAVLEGLSGQVFLR